MPSYVLRWSLKDGESLHLCFIATHHCDWAAIQAPMNTLLIPEEHWMILEKVRQEAKRLHELQPNNPIRAPVVQAIPGTEPGRHANDSRDLINHYKECLIAGRDKGVPKPKWIRSRKCSKGPGRTNPPSLKGFLRLTNNILILIQNTQITWDWSTWPLSVRAPQI